MYQIEYIATTFHAMHIFVCDQHQFGVHNTCMMISSLKYIEEFYYPVSVIH